MFSQKILVLGASGYVGSHIVRSLRNKMVKHVTLNRGEINIFDPKELSKFIKKNRISKLINCVGYTGKPNVDACEYNKDNCLMYNAILPSKIAIACENTKIKWCHISSGCIYDGYRKDGYTEQDEPNFCFGSKCSYYSGTKALSEKIITNLTDNCYIMRLRIPFTNIDNQRNYISKLLSFKILNDQQNSLSNLYEFSDACVDSLIRDLPTGVYNLTNPGSISAPEIIDMAQSIWGKKIGYETINPNELHTFTPRSNCVLNTYKAQLNGLEFDDIKVSIEKVLRSWNRQDNKHEIYCNRRKWFHWNSFSNQIAE